MRFTYDHIVDAHDGHHHIFTLATYVQMEELAEISAWCTEHFDACATTYTGSRWWVSTIIGQVWLRDDDDAFLFRMRWC